MADPSDLFPRVQRHGPITLSPLLEFGFGSGSGSNTEDLFHRRRVPAVSPDQDPGFLGLGLGLGFPGQDDRDWARHRRQEPEDEEASEDWAGDDFFIGCRSSGRGNEFFVFESDSEPDANEQIVAIGSGNEPGIPLCWDCLQIDEGERRDPSPAAAAEEFEWEEIDGSTDAVSAVIREEDYQEDISFEMAGIGVEEAADAARSGIEWEILNHHDTDAYYLDDGFEGHYHEDGFIYTSGYGDLFFGQFQEHDSSLKGGRPAAKSVVESLPTVVLGKEEVGENDVNCAVCKDEISAEEKAKKLPCCHYYHEECILRWLGMRSTCPLCRYELPTDDAEYEKRKARRAGGNGGEN